MPLRYKKPRYTLLRYTCFVKIFNKIQFRGCFFLSFMYNRDKGQKGRSAMKNYGRFTERLGGFTLTKFPKVGNYEYIYKNDELLLKVDQYGVQTSHIQRPLA